MSQLKYKVISSKKQYKEYCNILEELVFADKKSKQVEEEIDLLTLLIETYDKQNNSFNELDPIQLLHSLMKDHQMKPKDIVEILQISKGYVSDILNYKKGLSKDVIRTLAEHFKVTQEAFNKPYKLKVSENIHLRNASVMNTKKELVYA
jgi:HTH-type transcriptional regulator/antitoxin HigA